MDGIKVKVVESFQSDDYTIFITYRAEINKRQILTNDGKWVDWAYDSSFVPENCGFHLPGGRETAQQLADKLFEKGIKPSQYIPTKTELDAKDKHIDHLYHIIGHLLTKIKDKAGHAP